MKKLVFSFLFLTLFFNCDKNHKINESNLEKDEIFYIDGGCAKIIYQSKIGADFNSALDSLINKYEPFLNVLAIEGHYSGEGYDIKKEKINVDFIYDNRDFFFLTFTDNANIYLVLFAVDVIDENGNHFNYISCPD